MESYRVAYGQNLQQLILIVNEMVKEGYIPQGGISITIFSGFEEYHQAMFKP